MELQELVARIQRWKRQQSADDGAHEDEEAGDLGQTADSSGAEWEGSADDFEGDVSSGGEEASMAEISDVDIVTDAPNAAPEAEEDTEDFSIEEAIDIIEEK